MEQITELLSGLGVNIIPWLTLTASIITMITPTPKKGKNKTIDKVYDFIELIALVKGKAKQKS